MKMIMKNIEQKETRKIEDLFKKNDKIYIHLKNEKIGKQFMINATKEGFRFSDGKRPNRRKWHDIIAVFKDKTICYVGFIGHIFLNKDSSNIPRIDYERYINYDSDYNYKKTGR